MSPKAKESCASADLWLRPDEAGAWLAYMRVQQRLGYEMNRQLQTDSDLSLADYDVLNALSSATDDCLQVGALAALIGWERSRLSHQARRMEERGLVECTLSARDRRATEIRLTPEGRRASVDAAPGHVDLVRRLFFGGLPEALLTPLREALEGIYDHIVEHGTLPAPVRDG